MTKQEMIRGLNRILAEYEYELDQIDREALDMAIEALEQDEIIRCKDCKFNKGSHKCFNPKSVAIFPDDDDYCSFAETKGDDEE